MKFKLKAQTPLDFLIHLGIMVVVGALLLVGFFYIYLPSATQHGTSVTVPDLAGKSMDEVTELLEAQGLRFEVLQDSGYQEEAEPKSVLLQDPEGSKAVKEGRKVYLTLNSVIPPSVVMPNLTNGSSFRNAQLVLKSLGLRIGTISYRPDMAVGTVLEQRYNGKEVGEGFPVPLGAEIDLVLAESYGSRNFAMPLLKGLPLAQVEFTLRGMQLALGEVTYIPDTEGTPGVVSDQYPDPGNGVKIGDKVNVVLFEGEPIIEEDQELDSLNSSLMPLDLNP
ncbi:MAG TPA: penicillin-binding protein [Cytophagales bacterium]|nr:penicillin-binding protein [Cytophagales bacterium]HAA17307.1 penicillin-binding protein [Cytophagales bacterium]HAP62969.1 penicillin-binding protein [Cytophagales bacterium]